jgi:hypothetical protein
VYLPSLAGAAFAAILLDFSPPALALDFSALRVALELEYLPAYFAGDDGLLALDFGGLDLLPPAGFRVSYLLTYSDFALPVFEPESDDLPSREALEVDDLASPPDEDVLAAADELLLEVDEVLAVPLLDPVALSDEATAAPPLACPPP